MTDLTVHWEEDHPLLGPQVTLEDRTTNEGGMVVGNCWKIIYSTETLEME